MMITILNKSNSIFTHYLAEIRDQEIQKDSMRFRRNLERMGEIMAYEIS
ncbi:MAG TPA: uracil phosphoribosyltransferase, partial [Bacteroidales bacterium]